VPTTISDIKGRIFLNAANVGKYNRRQRAEIREQKNKQGKGQKQMTE
jgi:hypothetical protein